MTAVNQSALIASLEEQSALLEWAYTQIVRLDQPELQRQIQKEAEHSIGREFDGYLPSSQRAKALIKAAKS